MIFKNTAGQKWLVRAWDSATGLPKTGDAANITASIRKDNAAGVATNDEHPTELSAGYYAFEPTQDETNADRLDLIAVSATTGVYLVAEPSSILTTEHPDTPRLKFALNLLTTSGVSCDIRIWLETAAGEFIDVSVLDEEATASIIARELESVGELFDEEVPQANGGFETQIADPGFTADHMYIFTVTATVNGTTYTTQQTRNIFG